MVLGKTLKSLAAKFATPTAPQTPWRPLGESYPALHLLDPSAHGVVPAPGLVAIWHLGVRPQWLKVAAVANLQDALTGAAQVTAFTSYRPNGGVYVAWAPTTMPDGLGQASFLMRRFQPVLQAHALPAEYALADTIKALDFPFPPGTAQD